MNNKKKIISSIILTFLSIIYVYLVKIIDVKEIGPNNSSVGFSTINNWFKNFVGTNMKLYKLTEVFGLVIILIAVIYALVGLVELIKRKSIKKIDKEIISLGVLYVLLGLVYIFFEKFIINYRPIIIDGELEASFPSSHTMLAISICVSSLIVSKKYLSNKKLSISYFVTMFLLTIVVLGRTISGVHWFSDILGGVIISMTLLMYFYTIYTWKKN